MRLQDSDLNQSDADAGTEMKELEKMMAAAGVAKPVRVGMSKAKKKAVIMADASIAGDEKYNAKDHFVPKTPGEINSISEAVKNNFLFQHLNSQQVEWHLVAVCSFPPARSDLQHSSCKIFSMSCSRSMSNLEIESLPRVKMETR